MTLAGPTPPSFHNPCSQQYAKDLERERRTASGASRRASGLEAETEALRRDAHSLRQEADTLGRQREELAQQNTLLLLNNLALGTKAQKLQNEANELALANRRLTDQVNWCTSCALLPGLHSRVLHAMCMSVSPVHTWHAAYAPMHAACQEQGPDPARALAHPGPSLRE